jgi:hypothetical protein
MAHRGREPIKGENDMNQSTDVCPDNCDEVFSFLEEVYGNAYWALRYGATKEALIDQIEQAFECLSEQKKDGLF